MDVNATVPGGCSPEYAFKLWNLIIRPPRTFYDVSQLGPSEFIAGGVRAARRDVKIRTQRGSWIACSHFVPRQVKGRDLRKFPVIIYLHGNSSSRLEAWSLVGTLISQNISLFCYDAAGCGLSEGEYISLGWHERDDLSAVIEHLRQSPFCGPIGVWGRSMGAATALMHADRDPGIGAIALDSPFASLRQLAEELAKSDRILFPVPSWLVDAVLAVIRMRCQTLADFDIEDIVPENHAKRSFMPALFLHARGDTFVKPSHSQQLYDCYPGDKELVTVDGDHNTERGEQVVNHVVNFFKKALRVDHIDMTVPSHAIDKEFSVPERDGTPRVPPDCAQGAAGKKLPPPVASLPPKTLPKPPEGANSYDSKMDAADLEAIASIPRPSTSRGSLGAYSARVPPAASAFSREKKAQEHSEKKPKVAALGGG
eukprot:TRINITY_DN27081_c0_g1_i1.p1 TRINITY_DN27081_c0_g1~~TRINITY_DN27081_c0_g1_i1.p1  ORF type:complete len:426 (-),score=82.01 TRINITY_DN27081_c0_g1_i1:96-1373(-)